jgi:vitamin B12 transporter
MANRRLLFLAFLLSGFNRLALAQPDSVVHQLREVEITGQRGSAFGTGSRTTVADSVAWQASAQGSLTGLLQHSSAVYLKSYGPGNLATPSFRGTTANQTAIIWNGITLNTATTGLADLSLVPVAAIQNVAVQYGPQSALYGSGAVGGAVHLNNYAVSETEFGVQATQAFGSFRKRATELSGRYGAGKWQGHTAAYRLQAVNDFPFQLYNGQEVKTQNARQQATGLVQDVYFEPSYRQRLALHAWYQQADRQIPPYLSEAAYPAAKVSQQDGFLRLQAEGNQLLANGKLTARLALLQDQLEYRHPSLGTSSARTQTWLAELEQHQTWRYFTLQAGGNARLLYGRVKEYGGLARQEQYAAFASGKFLYKRLTVSASARQEWTTGFQAPLMPALGAELRLGERQQWILKARTSRSFRIPTFNERFWRPGGNPALLPETGWSHEAGISARSRWQRIGMEGEVTGFSAISRDLIIWRPLGSYWVPQNLQKNWARGVEATLKVSLLKRDLDHALLRLQGGYNFTRSTLLTTYNAREQPVGIQLTYVPQHTAHVLALLHTQFGELSYLQRYTGLVFYQTDHTGWLDPFQVSELAYYSPDVKAGRNRFSLRATVSNLTDERYQSVYNIPMPGRSFEVALTWRLGLKPFGTSTAN